MPFAENISIFQERSGGAVRVFIDIKSSRPSKFRLFEKLKRRFLRSYSDLLSTSSNPGSQIEE
jgi:hypothetical protein